MKIRLGRGATIAAGAVALSLFAILCMLPYGREDYLAPERILARKDALRFQIASLLVEPFGAGAFLGLGLVFVWSVIGFFRESVGAVLPRAVGLLAAVPSFCAMTSLGSDANEFWAGSLGMVIGERVALGFGPFLAWTAVGALFLVSMAMATELGFYRHLSTLRGSLSFPLLPPEEGAGEGDEGGVAVLEVPDPAEALHQPWEREVEALEEVPGDAGDVQLVDRDAHLQDVRRRLREGLPVTDAELDLLDAEAAAEANRDEAVAAMDSLFGGPEMDAKFPAPAATPGGEASAKAEADPGPLPFKLYEVPPFLLDPNSSHPLLGQEVATEGLSAPQDAAVAAASGIPAEEPPPSHARVIPEEVVKAAGTETEDLDPEETSRVVDQAIAWRSPYIFASVEFLPPNEELADPLREPEAEEGAAPAAAEAPEEESATAAATAPEASAPASGPEYSGFVVEDEVFSYGLEEEEHGDGAKSAAAAEEPAPAATPGEAAWLEDAARELASARDLEERLQAEKAMEIPEPTATASAPEAAPAAPPAFVDESFAAPPPAERTFVEETFPTEEPSPGTEASAKAALTPPVDPDDPASVLARLFGDPVTREEMRAEMPPAGPAHSEPREPPAASGGNPGDDPVTLLNDPDLGDCVKDHGLILDLDEEVVLPRVMVLDDPSLEGAAAEAPPPLSAEAAADAIVGSLRDLFGEPLVEAAPDAPADGDGEEPDAPSHHPGFGTLFPFLEDSAGAAEAIEARKPVRTDGPAPVVEPLDETEVRAEAEEEAVDEERVSRLVEELRSVDDDEGAEDAEEGPEPARPRGPVDDLYEQAVEAVRERGRGSVVVLQRKLGVGFTRASRLLEQLVARGVLGPENASGSHPVL